MLSFVVIGSVEVMEGSMEYNNGVGIQFSTMWLCTSVEPNTRVFGFGHWSGFLWIRQKACFGGRWPMNKVLHALLETNIWLIWYLKLVIKK